MLRPAIAVALMLALPGLAAFAMAQESTGDQFLSVGDDPNWFLQRAGCTLARSENGNGDPVIRFQMGMGAQLEIMGTRPRVRNNDNVQIVLTVDGVAEQTYGIGLAWEGDGRSGYRIPISDELLERIAAGRRLEIRAGAQGWPAFDLAGAAPAIAAMRACYDEMAGDTNMMMEASNSSNAM